MIPQHNLSNTELYTEPSFTYKFDFNKKRISGVVDEKEAVLQAAMKILTTEKYACVIYDGQYGVQLERFIGKPYDFIVSDIERTISEALLYDDRITSISNFTVQKTGIDSLLVSFTVNTVFGSGTLQIGVQIL